MYRNVNKMNPSKKKCGGGVWGERMLPLLIHRFCPRPVLPLQGVKLNLFLVPSHLMTLGWVPLLCYISLKFAESMLALQHGC